MKSFTVKKTYEKLLHSPFLNLPGKLFSKSNSLSHKKSKTALQNPKGVNMLFSFILYTCALFADGATDAANSVTGAVSSKAIKISVACAFSALLTFIGCIIFCTFFPAVFENTAAVWEIDKRLAPIALCASLAAVSLWSLIAWIMGLPTSEGHALVSSAAGSALALSGRISTFHFTFAALGMIPVLLICFASSVLFTKILAKINMGEKTKKYLVIASTALSSILHGAQDGQNFLALAMGMALFSKDKAFQMVVFTGLIMSLGTILAGQRIIKSMGESAAPSTIESALAADIASCLSLIVLTFFGIIASTTHAKMTALAAASRAAGEKVSVSTLLLMLLAWIATFPLCFALSFFLSKLFYIIFL